MKINRVRDVLQTSLNDSLTGILAGTGEEKKWNDFKSIVYKVSKKLGNALPKLEDWFERNSLVLEELISQE